MEEGLNRSNSRDSWTAKADETDDASAVFPFAAEGSGFCRLAGPALERDGRALAFIRRACPAPHDQPQVQRTLCGPNDRPLGPSHSRRGQHSRSEPAGLGGHGNHHVQIGLGAEFTHGQFLPMSQIAGAFHHHPVTLRAGESQA